MSESFCSKCDRQIMNYFPYCLYISQELPRRIIVEWCNEQFGGEKELVTIHSGDRYQTKPVRTAPMTLFNEWLFSEDHLAAARFTYYDYKFFFKYEKDAVLFKLRWDNK